MRHCLFLEFMVVDIFWSFYRLTVRTLVFDGRRLSVIVEQQFSDGVHDDQYLSTVGMVQ
jgi:hypothetical protein